MKIILKLIRRLTLAVFILCPLIACPGLQAQTAAGFTLHFDFINNWEEARQMIVIAHDSGAEILNVVPPAHIWELPASREILHNIFKLTKTLHMHVVLSRIDACAPAVDDPKRANYLFAQILKRRGVLPDGKLTPSFFRETVGLRSYEKWMREETEYYSENYSGEDNLAGFSVGLFNEPFVSQRGSLLCFDNKTNSYEIGQYTKPCLEWWQAWLIKKYGSVDGVNQAYNTSFSSFSAIPMPKNEEDKRFGNSQAAYWGLVSSINDWVVEQYRDCAEIWHKHAKRPSPLIFQFSGYVPEKYSKGRPAFAALDIYSWMQMSDAVGLSLYTNKEYPDWGHASDTAMVNFVYLGVMQKKHIFVMEGGIENNGAVLPPKELDFLAETARLLKPDSYIYEFLTTPFYVNFSHYDGYIINRKGKLNNKALVSIKAVFEKAKQEAKMSKEIYIYDDPASLSLYNGDLDVQKQLQVMALEKTLIFVPGQSLSLIPQGATLLVVGQNIREEIFKQLSDNGIKIVSAGEWIKLSAGHD